MKHLTSALALALGLTGAAQAQGFDPRDTCGTIFANPSAADQAMIAAWTFGYLAASTDNVRPVGASNNQVIVQNILKVCRKDPSASLLDIVAASAPAKPSTPVVQVEPGSAADARALLHKFLEPGADHRALTQAILPTKEEVLALYAEPLGSAMWANYAAQMGPGVAFAPKQGQTSLLVVHATTRELVDRKPVLNEFPGGYGDVLQYFKIDVPIVRFKFVAPGETLGLAFDGLVYLNGRWVIMPKPWRSLPG